MRISAATLLAALLTTGNAAAQTDDAHLTVRGILPDRLAAVGGSATVLAEPELQRMQPVTAKEVLRRLPGVQVVDEDALGLKLNVSVRGLNARRSGRTLLLEDGAPIQPAPYADPSAHHYTPLERTSQIEFRKGSAQILFGPQSIGGVINFVTAPVPRGRLAELSLAAGSRDFLSAHAALGAGDATAGLRLDLLRKSSDGIRQHHGTRVSEGALKAQLIPDPAHRLVLKAAYYAERTRLSEGGLNEARFAISPWYNPFRHDRFRLNRKSAHLIHDWSLSDAASVSTQIYMADTFRASYRQADTSVDAMVANPATGCTGAARLDYEGFAEHCGNKMRPRRFRFWGIEPRLVLATRLGDITADTTFGLRAHIERTRRQRFNGLTANARESTPGTVLRDDNDIDTNAYAAYAQTVVAAGRWRFSPGVRLERIETRNRSRVANFAAVDQTARSAHTIALPGFGMSWEAGDRVIVFAGVHRGFAPPRPDRDINPLAPFGEVRPERSTELEAGLRTKPSAMSRLDIAVFQMLLSDLIVEGQLVGGRSGTFANAGRARHRGIEIEGEWASGPLRFGITYTWLQDARFPVGRGGKRRRRAREQASLCA